MKMNWGVAIAIFYTLFVIIMISMVVISRYYNRDLVMDDYFLHDLNYEKYRMSRENGNGLADPVTVEYITDKGIVSVDFPSNMTALQGNVSFFRPSDERLDTMFTLILDEHNNMDIAVANRLKNGLWKVKVNWLFDGTHFNTEKEIIL